MTESIRTTWQSQAGPHTRARATARITVQSSEAKPYDQTASPALLELHLSETSAGISTANRRCELYSSCATINPPRSPACNDSVENWADAGAPSHFEVQKW